MLTPILIAAIVGYLLGALPFGYLVARAKGVNIFEVGSKNPGATNVRRVLGRGAGNLVLLLDALKGALAVVMACFRISLEAGHASIEWHHVNTAGSLGDLLPPITAVIAAVLGHSFSCFTHFKGGKSVATGAGAFLVLFPTGMLIALAIWALTAAFTRYVSLASMLGALSLPISGLIMRRSTVLVVVAAVVVLFVIVRHRANIFRLLAGTESKIGQKAPGPASTALPKS